MTMAQNLLIDQLQNENEILQDKLSEQNEKIVHLDEKILLLQEQLSWFKRQLFGKKSERDVSQVNPEQLELEGFQSLEQDHQQTKTINSYRRRKPENKGKESIILPKDLPVETVIIDIPQE